MAFVNTRPPPHPTPINNAKTPNFPFLKHGLDDDDNKIVVACNNCCKFQGWEDASLDEATSTTCLAREDGKFSREDEARSKYVATTPCMVLPFAFGGTSPSKIANKWKRKIRNFNQRRHGHDENPIVETYLPRPSPQTTNTLGACMPMTQVNNLQDPPSPTLIFDTHKS